MALLDEERAQYIRKLEIMCDVRETHRKQIDALLAACKAVVGHGYCEGREPSSQDYVSKSAIALVRKAIRKVERST